MSAFIDNLRYKTPVDVMKQKVTTEIVASQVVHGKGWLGDYFYNFHFLFPYQRDGISYPSINLGNASASGDEKVKHGKFRFKHGVRELHSDLFLSVSPVQMDMIRVLLAAEMGDYGERYLEPVNSYFQSRGRVSSNELEIKRGKMFKSLEPLWIRFRALGFNNQDLKS